ncbi:hypothetical protein C3L33_14282, partial [Rhododendron williamsianum]
MFLNKQCARNTLLNGSKKSEANKSQKATDDKTLYAVDNPKVKPSMMGCRKRGLPGVGYRPEEKRRKSIRDAMEHYENRFVMQWNTSPLELSFLPESLMSADEKQKLRKQLLEVSRGNVPPYLRGFHKEIGVNCREREGRIELDMDAFAEEILLKLKRIVRLVGDKVDPLKLQQEKGRLEKQQREDDFLTAEKARKDGQVRAAIVASAEAALKKKREQERETELKRQQERERKAARLALQQVEKTIAFDDNFQVLKD